MVCHELPRSSVLLSFRGHGARSDNRWIFLSGHEGRFLCSERLFVLCPDPFYDAVRTAMDVKICIIGAGSAVFSLDLVRDLCLTDSLQGSTVSLVDINEQRLDAIHDIARRYANETNTSFTFEKSRERGKALEDADFVINTALVGGHENQELQRKVAERHGYYRGVGDIISDYYSDIGSYHQLKFAKDLTEEMEGKCPDAWLLQTSNPVFEICTMLTRETRIKTLGLCDGFDVGCEVLTDALGLDRKDVLIEASGLNHIIWMTKFLHKGMHAYPILDEWLEEKMEAYYRDLEYIPEALSPAAIDMYRTFGLFPIGDTARVGNWWYHIDPESKERWYGPAGGMDSEVGDAIYLKFIENKLNEVLEVAKDQSASVTKNFPLMRSIQQHIQVIDAIVNDNEGRFQLNVPNVDAISGIASDLVVEIPASVSKRGARTLFRGELPKRIVIQTLIPRILRMELVIEAFLTGDRQLLLDLILNDRRTESPDQAKALLDDILGLPFNKPMADHYK